MPLRFAARALLAVSALTALACSSTQTAGSSAPAPAPAAAKSAALPAGVTPLMIAQGDTLFHGGSCVRCHGADAKGTARGANLTDAEWSQISGSYAEIVQVITTGVPADKIKLAGATFPMRPRGGSNMSDEAIAKVAAYVYSLSHH